MKLEEIKPVIYSITPRKYMPERRWTGRSRRCELLLIQEGAGEARLGNRLGEVPQFAAYAIADGLKRAFTRFGKWVRTAAETVAAKAAPAAGPLLPGFADMLDLDDG